ncbi:hypothetical protein JL721_12861 [Aureococcus anophagefferens]|nr:hypothetical protein JL721_12861 [Aureococcus anophagefferens]
MVSSVVHAFFATELSKLSASLTLDRIVAASTPLRRHRRGQHSSATASSRASLKLGRKSSKPTATSRRREFCAAIKKRRSARAREQDTCSWIHHKKKCKGKRKACVARLKKKCHKSKYHNFCKWSYKKTKCRKVKCKEIGAADCKPSRRTSKKGCEWKDKHAATTLGGRGDFGHLGVAERGRHDAGRRGVLNDGAGSWAGHARVFAWDPVDETWKQRGDDIDGEAAGDESGISVSLSADGTRWPSGRSTTTAPAPARATRACSRGTPAAGVEQRGRHRRRAADDRSGYSVSLSADGTTLAVGAPYNDGAGSSAGHAGGDIDGEAADDWSGYSVSLSADGTALAVRAVYNDGAGSNAGRSRGDDIDGEAAYDSGYSVSLSADGTALAVGASGSGGANAGPRVYSISR